MDVEQPQPNWVPDAGSRGRSTRLAAFVVPHLQAGEQVRAMLTKTGEPNPLIDLLASFAMLYGLADVVATHRALVVTSRHLLIVHMPWLRAWSIEHVSGVDAWP